MILLTGCSGNYTFDSNMKADGARQYFSASQVQIFDNKNEFTSDYELIGLVEGDDCQEKPHLAPPDPIKARTQARQAANALDANAVIFTSCIDIENKFCTAQIVCYGQAYRLSEHND